MAPSGLDMSHKLGCRNAGHAFNNDFGGITIASGCDLYKLPESYQICKKKSLTNWFLNVLAQWPEEQGGLANSCLFQQAGATSARAARSSVSPSHRVCSYNVHKAMQTRLLKIAQKKSSQHSWIYNGFREAAPVNQIFCLLMAHGIHNKVTKTSKIVRGK